MPTYEFRCRTCDTTFELRRSMQDSSAPAVCPEGHDDAVRLLSVFASVGGATSRGPAPSMPAMPAGGCGAGCGCHH